MQNNTITITKQSQALNFGNLNDLERQARQTTNLEITRLRLAINVLERQIETILSVKQNDSTRRLIEKLENQLKIKELEYKILCSESMGVKSETIDELKDCLEYYRGLN